MRGDDEVIGLLNEVLTAELTAINQYFLHAKMQQNWGYVRLARHTREESIEEMRHAERLTDRILFLEGLPNYQKLNPLRIGQTVTEQLEADLALEMEAVTRLRSGIELMRSRGDVTSARIFEYILEDEEKHIDDLLRAVALLRTPAPVRLQIVGDGSCRRGLEELAAELGIAEQVHFAGLVDEDELLDAYARADLFCMPSIAELQSLATMEAMSAGTPVLLANAMSLPHLV